MGEPDASDQPQAARTAHLWLSSDSILASAVV